MIDQTFAASDAATQERDRTKIAEAYTWNLNDLYPSDAAWQEGKAAVAAQIPLIQTFKGTLSQSPQQLVACLETSSQIGKAFSRLYSYASMHSDQDTRIADYQAMKQEMQQLGNRFSSEASYIEPEILGMDKSVIERFLQQEPKLEVYRHYLFDILRRQAHTGSEAEEKIIAHAGLMAGNAQNTYSIFSNAEFPYPEVTLSEGKTMKLDKSAFALQRASPNREDRKMVFKVFFDRLGNFRSTFGTQLYGDVKKNLFYSRARRYNSALEASLDANHIPVQVYKSLITHVNDNLATFHRYLKLRQRILCVNQLHYYDLYAPLLKDVDMNYSVAEAQQHIVTSLAPLGEEYTRVIEQAFTQRWIDMYPSEGKRSGAYSNGSAYDVHPYILMNYNGRFDDMSTLTHELGHTMQSYLSNKTQPFPLAHYPIFVAEVASTFNEALLIDYMLQHITDDAARLSLLGNFLEGIKGTVFRQTQFAEFELRIHEVAEKGEALTGDRFSEIYMELTKKYYGHDQGVCIIDEEVAVEWAYIPHFYYNFYVYQYATSFTASAALSEKVLAGDPDTTQKYLQFLSAGGSKYPIDLLKEAGVDMTTAQPFTLTMQKMNRVMDEMEEILVRLENS
jgi:oligoendopeptidase F